MTRCRWLWYKSFSVFDESLVLYFSPATSRLQRKEIAFAHAHGCIPLQHYLHSRISLWHFDSTWRLAMAALRSRCGHYICALWFLLFYSSPNLSSRRLDVYRPYFYPYFYTWCGFSAKLECMSEMFCTRLAGNTGRKNRHLRTIAQLCLAVFSQLRHVSTIGKNLVKQQYLFHMSSQYGELRPTNGWDRFVSLGHPNKFQWLSRVGSVTAGHSITGRLRNFAALNRGRHLYSARRPSRWALAHILVLFFLA